jgi:ferric-dicitrate binding protein FerR (iron transport regulator)
MKGDLNYRVLARYLAGEESGRDAKEINKWLNADASNKRKLEEFQHIWKSAAIKADLKKKWTEIDEDWKEIKKRKDQQKPNVAKRLPKLDVIPSRHSRGTLKPFLQAAAIVLIAGFISLFAYEYWPKKEAPAMRNISTQKGEQMSLTLSDGTRILLNSDSKLKLPQKFGSGKREIYLRGEAYFHVVHKSDKPFLVHTKGTTTRDLGTSFVIRAYPRDNNILLAVVEGRVQFEPDTIQSGPEDILTEKQLIKYDVKKHRVVKKNIKDLSIYLGWTKGQLNFKNALMTKVARRLERRYNVKVIFKDPNIKKMKLTASLKSRTITDVLNVIAKALDIRYSIDKNKVVFTY